MIVAHRDSHGNPWYFRFNAPRASVQRIARNLLRKAVRVTEARNSNERARALLVEAVTHADYQAYNAATVEEWNAATADERFII